jgi:hypothetical protein
MKTGMGWMCRELCMWEVGVGPGWITDESKTTYTFCVPNYIQIEPKKSQNLGLAFTAPIFHNLVHPWQFSGKKNPTPKVINSPRNV